jgi:hypothetical protein
LEPECEMSVGAGSPQQLEPANMNGNSFRGAPITLLVLLFLSALAPYPAEARHNKAGHRTLETSSCSFTNDGRGGCAVLAPTTVLVVPAATAVTAMADTGSVIGGRPNDCPHAYCGCGLRKYLGLSDKRLNLASNWARLLAREPGPRAGVAAVRNHHVMYIEGATSKGQWLVRDYNSGGGLSRLHVRDVRGYVFVNPHTQLANR